MAANTCSPMAPTPSRWKQQLSFSYLSLAVLASSTTVFCNNMKVHPAFYTHQRHGNFHERREIHNSAETAQTSPFVVATSIANSIEPDMNANIEELESLHKMRRETLVSPRGPTNVPSPVEKRKKQQLTNAVPKPKKVNSAKTPNFKPTIRDILQKPEGKLTSSDLNSLCNSIRYHRKGMSFQNLKVLGRILVELDQLHYARDADKYADSTATILKPLHIFSTLTALSKDIRSWKQKVARKNQKPRRATITEDDIQRLIQVVTLLKQQQRYNDQGCYSSDVPSFAAMIAAEASQWESVSHAAIDAALLFLDMVEEEEGERAGGSDGKIIEWDPRLIGAVLDALARVGRAEEAQALLEQALGVIFPNYDDPASKPEADGVTFEESSGRNMRLDPSHAGHCYDALLKCWSKKASLEQNMNEEDIPPNSVPPVKSSMAQARHILLNYIPLQPEVTITNRTCSAVLGGYSLLGMGMESEQLVMELEALHLSPLYSSSLPVGTTFPSSLDDACYNSVLNAYSRSQDWDAVASAERLFTCMKEQTALKVVANNSSIGYADAEEEGSSIFSVVPPKPDLISFSSMLNCYSKHGKLSKAEALLEEMQEAFMPNVACYLPVMTALGKSDDKDAPERVLKLLEQSCSILHRPNRLLYISALRCMRRHGRGDKAENILDQYHEAFPNKAPDVYAHTLVLRAWEKTRPEHDRYRAAKRAKVFLEKMEEMAEASLLPALDINAYNILLNCYARASEAERAEEMLATLEGRVQPNSKSYNTVIKAWANSNEVDAVDRAWNVLYRLGYPRTNKAKQRLADDVPFNASIDNFNSMLMLFAKRGMASEAEALLGRIDELVVEGTGKGGGPNIQSYEAVLEALGRCGDADAPVRAEALVTRMEVLSEMGGDFQPSLLAYNTLLNCYANAGMAGKAERLLEKLQDRDSFSVGSTIKAIANSGKSQPVSMSSAKSLANTVGSDNSIINAHMLKLLSKWGLGNEAENLLWQMRDRGIEPGVIHYTAALNAWAKSKDGNAVARAEKLFRSMEESDCDLDLAAYHGLLLNYSTRGNSKNARRLLQSIKDSPDIEPNRNTFTMVMDSYARSRSTEGAARKAEELLDEMRELHATGNRDAEPDRVTYASAIRCKQSRDKKIQSLTALEKLGLMQELQIETWPFDEEQSSR